jgi:hypothetical protein
MKKCRAQIQALTNSVVEKAKARKGKMAVRAVAVLGAFFVLQFYFVRELLAAELLFGIAFAVLLVLGGLAYLVGSVGERGLDYAEAGIRMMGDMARRGFTSAEGISRKPSSLQGKSGFLDESRFAPRTSWRVP